MQRQRDDVVARRELGQKRIGGRTGGTTLAGKKLDHDGYIHDGAIRARRGGRREAEDQGEGKGDAAHGGPFGSMT